MVLNKQIAKNINYKQSLLIDKLVLALYSLYFILNPFYLWRSGLPQIADFILVASMLLFAFRSKFVFYINEKVKTFMNTGLLFISWILFVNLTWILRTQTVSSFLMSSLFYIYNYIVTIYVVVISEKYGDKIFKNTFYAIIVSLLIQIIIYFFAGDFAGVRNAGSFNNPNQLGYYSLLMLSFILYLSVKIPNIFIWVIVGIFSNIILVFSSLSKAAILSFVGLLLFYLFSKSSNRRFKRKIVVLVIIFSLGTGLIYYTTEIIQNNQLLNLVQRRIESIGTDSDDSLEGRGYYRIYEYPEYWLFGAGEGDFSRFKHKSMEFHSTLGNIQVSYGLIGTLLFANFMLLALKNEKYRSSHILFFLMMYGLTHNGIRDSLLWILLGFMASRIEKIDTIIQNDGGDLYG